MTKNIKLKYDEIYISDKTLEVHFNEKRIVTSTSFFGGGTRKDVSMIFNYDETDENGMCTMRSEDMEEHMRLLTEELGYDTQKTVGLTTAVSIKNSVIKTVKYHDIDITVITTAGVDVNGGRAGDPAGFDELEYMRNKKDDSEKISENPSIKPGTINIILIIDAYLPEGTLNRVMMTATEAKSAALSELMARSMYSFGIATGSGTDGIIATCLFESDDRLTNAGNHAKLGELIGKIVNETVKKALYLHTGMDEKRQGALDERVKRYGVDLNLLLEKHHIDFRKLHENILIESNMRYSTESLSNDISLMIHLMDQFRYGILSKDELKDRLSAVMDMILRNISDDNMMIGLCCERLKSVFKFMDITDDSLSKILEISLDMAIDLAISN